MTGWSIKGEASKALDATERLLSAVNADSGILYLAALDTDYFEYSIATADAAGTGAIIPDAAQQIELWHDGTRRFRGHVTIPRVTTNQIVIRAEGPWWWMSRIMLSSSQNDGTGSAAERPSYVFATQDLKTSIEALITRGALLSRTTAGDAATAKFALGTVDAMFVFPRITLSEMSIAQALAELLSIVPDAVAWVSYAGTGIPTVNVTRRGNMAAQTFAVGTDAVEQIDIGPRLDLQVSQVQVQSVARRAGTDGQTQWVIESAGTAAAGKNQIVVVSGPEVNDFLPRDSFDTFSCQSMALPAGTIPSAFSDFVLANDTTLATIVREYGLTPIVSETYRYLVSNYTTGNPNGAWGIQLIGPKLMSKSATAGLYIAIAGDRIPEWAATENALTVTDAILSGWAYFAYQSTTGPLAVWDDVVKLASAATSGYKINVTSAPGNYQYNAFFNFSIPVQLVSTEYAALTTVYRQWDYDYLAPPAGLAANLLAAQNWIPWEGYLANVADDVDGAPGLNLITQVTGTLADCATMGALCKSISYDILRGRKTISLGAPPRIDFGTLASRFRRHPKDNIVYL
jgi:hypothetical protein